MLKDPQTFIDKYLHKKPSEKSDQQSEKKITRKRKTVTKKTVINTGRKSKVELSSDISQLQVSYIVLHYVTLHNIVLLFF
jgi:hypothetical protein